MRIDAQQVFNGLEQGHKQISLEGQAFLTKSGDIHLKEEVEVDSQMINELNQLEHWSVWCKRAKLDAQKIQHYPVRYLATTHLNRHRDIFVYFPHKGQKEFRQQVFGLEFVDTSDEIFKNVVAPCLKSVFWDSPSLNGILSDAGKLVYMGAVLHEGLHQIGPWQMVPKALPNIKLSSHLLACWGELAADTLIGVITPEDYQPFLAHVLMKIFWYGRFEVKDNDSWGGEVMLLLAIESGLISKSGDKYDLNGNQIESFLRLLLNLLLLARPDEDTLVTDESVIKAWDNFRNHLSKNTIESKMEIYQRCVNHPIHVLN